MNPLLIQADARALPLADASVHMCVTSPPYWGLRDYGVAGQIGLEPTLSEYLSTMVGVFREVRRVLRDDGTCWVNMGDGYAHGVPGGGCVFANGRTDGRDSYEKDKARGREKCKTLSPGLKPKDLLMQPHRLAIALQDDGWYVRSDIVWHKPNPMPESVTDRPTKSHEYIFLLSKSPAYFFDQEAVREASTGNIHGRGNKLSPPRESVGIGHSGWQRSMTRDAEIMATGRNIRTVWTMPTRPCKEAHFATFPIDLPLRCIKAGTSEKGVCPVCGAPWRRVVEKIGTITDGGRRKHAEIMQGIGATSAFATGTWNQSKTTHWLSTCQCPAHDPIPATVLDPFGGAATTALACLELNRRAVIVERKWEYIGIGRGRIERWTPMKVKRPRNRQAKPEPLLFS